MCGVLILQQLHDLTDAKTMEAVAFNLAWHYALDVHRRHPSPSVNGPCATTVAWYANMASPRSSFSSSPIYSSARLPLIRAASVSIRPRCDRLCGRGRAEASSWRL
jgi:hypothetical protein